MESHNIENLLTAYFEGASSLEEEAILLDYFNNQKVATHLLQYKPIFVGLSAAQKETSKRSFELQISTNTPKIKTWWYTVAAMIVVAFGIGAFYFSQPQLSQEEREALVAFENSKKAMLLLSENLNKGTQQLLYVNQFELAKDKFWKSESE
ncbi:hypothetical protein EI546_15695 [Aequorivita sp. H23M31]|uniref:Anti-sigma factor n=1 Tax=Aequorivita ciconiae TaxID=2494375 RepID=A0A410G6Z2_9FLAO|nr:hypothetical protein [Aequorivita sp. H23M31]QAA83068.1 hypothetical protein EI546_15695 [Aequorivita sp. H23M31]